MNDSFLPRLLGAPLGTALGSFPVAVIPGARQTGKSTLVRQERDLQDLQSWGRWSTSGA
ncbi:MAG TPA: hypothetical protein VMM92_03200 [Thermoanaerobaculia bacterium]|nr:hypothetical protein [Thermoanaerobaculia bacterium]